MENTYLTHAYLMTTGVGISKSEWEKKWEKIKAGEKILTPMYL